MAGSVKWMEYTDDFGIPYAAKVDESNGEVGGFNDVSPAEMDLPELPKGLVMRHVVVKEPVTGATRKIWVGNRDDGLALGTIVSLALTLLSAGGLATALTVFDVIRFVGETRRRVTAADTGLTDGDAT